MEEGEVEVDVFEIEVEEGGEEVWIGESVLFSGFVLDKAVFPL